MVVVKAECCDEENDLGTGDGLVAVGHSYTFPLLRPRTKDAPVVRSFIRKKSGKNSIDVLLWVQN